MTNYTMKGSRLRVIDALNNFCWQSRMEIVKSMEAHAWKHGRDTGLNLPRRVKIVLSEMFRQNKVLRRVIDQERTRIAKDAVGTKRGGAGFEYMLPKN